MAFYLILIALAILVSLFQIYRLPYPSIGDIFEILLQNALVFLVGVFGLLGFYAHVFMSDETARYIGWPTGNLFQHEVGNANLAFGVLGVLCAIFRGNFWLATIIGNSIWFWGDAYVHIRDIAETHNYAPGNAGAPLYLDIFLPLVLWALYLPYCFLKREDKLR